jgi:hypothetical protein
MFSAQARQGTMSSFYRALNLRRKRVAAAALAVPLVIGTVAVAYARRAGDATSPVPVVVELFTSEGCSSCPPADTFLRKVDALQPIRGVEVIGIEEHVDYWNQDGWVDPYSALEWTNRQEEYVMKFKDNGPYTPQMIVDGDKQMNDASPAAIFNAIRQAAEQQRLLVSVQKATADGKDSQQFAIRVTSSGSAEPAKADVFLAVTEDGLQMNVTSGENKGRTLEHAAVVRSLEKIGTISDKGSDKSGGATFTADQRVKFKSSWKKPNLHVVVFVQDHKTLQIVGAGSANVTG